MTTQRSGTDPRQGRFIERIKEHPVRNYRWRRRELEQYMAEHPDLSVSEDAGVLTAHRLGDRLVIYYGYDSEDAMRLRFEPMLTQLAAHLSRADSPPEMWAQFEDRPRLHWLEPAFQSAGFEMLGDWLRLVCPDLPAAEAEPSLPAGVTLRAATEADVAALAAIDAASFAPWVLGAAALRQLIAEAATFQVAEKDGAIAGFVCLQVDRSGRGDVHLLAVQPAHRRQGLGRALLAWALWWLRQHDMVEAEALIATDNSVALNLYRSLGFAPPREGGFTFRRLAGWQKPEPVYRYKPVEEEKVQPFFWIKPRWD